MKQLPFVTWLLFFSSLVNSETPEELSLSVKPTLCIIDQRSKSCDIKLILTWQASANGDYCLHSEVEEPELKCWEQQRWGEHGERRKIQRDFSYWIQDQNDEQRRATTAIEVLRKDTGDRRRNRRSRHVWDIL